jgi:hypothetical protein
VKNIDTLVTASCTLYVSYRQQSGQQGQGLLTNDGVGIAQTPGNAANMWVNQRAVPVLVKEFDEVVVLSRRWLAEKTGIGGYGTARMYVYLTQRSHMTTTTLLRMTGSVLVSSSRASTATYFLARLSWWSISLPAQGQSTPSYAYIVMACTRPAVMKQGVPRCSHT